MPISEAQKRATAKYQREKVKRFSVAFYPDDMPLWELINQQPNKQGYVKDLIRADMERKAAENQA